MNIQAAIESFVSSRQLGRGGAVRVHKMWFDIWQRWRGHERPGALGQVNAEELRAFFSYLHNDYTGKTGRTKRLSAYSRLSAWRSLRALWHYCDEEGWLNSDQRSYFPRRVPAPVVEEEPRAAITPELFDELITAANHQPEPFKALRDTAILWLLWESGARASEACGIMREHLDLAGRRARVRGKGGRWGWLLWGDETAAALDRYMLWRPITPRHDVLFVSVKRPYLPMTYNALRLSVTHLAEDHDIPLPAGATIHALRHGFAHRMLDAGVDGLHLQQLMRHRSIETTTRYVREHAPQLQEIHRQALKRGKK